MVLSCTSKDRTTISQCRHASSSKKKKRARGKRPNWDACTASNVCCLLAGLHMTKYGRKKALFPVSNKHKKRKTQGFHMLCRQIEPRTQTSWPQRESEGTSICTPKDSATWRLSSITQQNIPSILAGPNHIQSLFYTILSSLRKKTEKSFSLPAFLSKTERF